MMDGTSPLAETDALDVREGLPRVVRKAFWLGLIIIGVGVLVLLGWAWHISWLKSLLPGFVAMKANAAAGFVLSGMSLACWGLTGRHARLRILALACAGTTVALGLLTLCEYVSGVNLGIDQCLFREASRMMRMVNPGRMTSAAAVGFLLAGGALVLSGWRRTLPAGQCLAVLTGLLGMFSLLTYLYGASLLFGLGRVAQMAVPTGLLFVLTSLGVYLLHPAEGLMRTITPDTMGGWLLRRMMPFVIGGPLVLGWFRVEGERRGYFEGPLGVALVMANITFMLAVLVWWTARKLNRMDAVRRKAEAELRSAMDRLQESEASYRDQFAANSAVMLLVDPVDGAILDVNAAATAFYGYPRERLLAMRVTDLNKQPAAEVLQSLTTISPEKGQMLARQHTLADGSLRDVEVSVSRVHLGGRILLHSIIFDITERKRAEEALRTSRLQLGQAMDLAQIVNWEYDVETDHFIFDERFYALYGTTAAREGGNRMTSAAYAREFVLPADIHLVAEEIGKALHSKEARYETQVAHRIIRRDGAIRHVFVHLAIKRDADGRVISLHGANQDITERKQAEEALRTSQLQLAQAMDLAQIANFEYDLEADQFLFDERFYALYGTTTAREGGNRMSSADYTREFIHPADAHMVAEEIGKAMQSKDAHYEMQAEQRIIRRDGAIRHILVRVVIMRDADGRILRHYGVNQDITERKRAEEALRTSRLQLAQAMDLAQIVNWEYDVATDHFIFDERFYALFGTTAAREGGNRMPSAVYAREFVHPADAHMVAEAIGKAMQSKEAHYEMQVEHRIVRRDGAIRHMLVDLAIIRDADGRILRHYGVNQDITERKQAEESLRIERENLKAIFASSPVGMLLLDEDTMIVDANSVLARMVSRNLGQILRQRGGGGLGCIHSLENKDGCGHALACPNCPLRNGITQVLKSGKSIRGAEIQATLMINGKQHSPWLSVSAEPVLLNGRKHVVVAIEDITARKRTEEQLREHSETLQAINVELESQQTMMLAQTREMRALLDGMPGHSFLKDRDGRYLAANQMFCRMLGKREEEIIGTTDMDLFPPDLALKRMADDQQVLGAEIPLLETEDLIGQGQNQAWMLTRKIPVPAVDGTVARLIGVSIDITARKAMEEALRTAARTDKLTGLPNRTMLCDRVQQAVLRSRLVPDYHFAVLFLDFDRFKTINDSLGHDVGDQLLQEIANRLRTIVRAGDSLSRLGGEHITARLGGDEFVVLLDDIAVPDDAALVADRLLLAFAQPYELGPHRVFSTASIGIVTSNLPFECAEDILRDADTAMYEAKMAGKNQYVLFDAAMRQRVQNRLTLENDLHKAVDAGQLFLMYEPIVSLQTGQIESFEALVRWRHPERGVISPAEFIPIAEDTGLIITIGEWVLREACRQFAQWRSTMGPAAPQTISVNLSRNQLVQQDLPQRIRRILEQTGVAPGCLHLEVTESAIMTNIAAATGMLQAIKKIGVKIDMDDFGTGYSSLACLHEFPIDRLKIDRSFISNINRGRDFMALVQAATQLANNLNISVVAEGIENQEQAMVLQALDCQFGQGYFFSRPMRAQDVPDFKVHPFALPLEAVSTR